MTWLGDYLNRVFSARPAMPMPPEAVEAPEHHAVIRARSMVGRGKYRLGTGGRKPTAPAPFDRDGYCDCSGFTSWALGLDRYQPGRIAGDWLSTDAMYADAMGSHRLFDRIPGPADAAPGDLVVYRSKRNVAGVRTSIGHVGVVADGGGETWADLRVVHCAASGAVAVRESDAALWGRRSGIVIRLRGA